MEVPSSGISAAEKAFLLEGIAANCREDGRSNLELRPLSVTAGVIPTAFGSAQAGNGEAAVIAGVRAELVAPAAQEPEAGAVFVNVSFASPAAVDRALAIVHEDHVSYGQTLSTVLRSLMFSPHVYPLRDLCVARGVFVWHLYIDLLVLSIGGALVDVASVAVLSALRAARLPAVKFVADTGFEAELTPDLLEAAPPLAIKIDPRGAPRPIPNAAKVPLLVSVGIIGQSLVADLTLEESYAVSHIVYGAVAAGEGDAPGQICGLRKAGGAPLQMQILSSINLRLVNIAKATMARFSVLTQLSAPAAAPALSAC